MKPATKTLIASAGWLAALFIVCTAHADVANKVSWTLVIDFDPYHVGSGAKRFNIENATCHVSSVVSGDDQIRGRSMSCDVGDKHIADVFVSCDGNENDVHMSPLVIVGKHIMQLGCTGKNF